MESILQKYKKILITCLTVTMVIVTGYNMSNAKAIDDIETNLTDENSNKEFTKIDEDGNVTYMTDEEINASGLVEVPKSKGRSAVSTINNAYGVVNFRTKTSDTNTSYTDTLTGRAGYTNGTYAADAAYLGHSSDGQVIFMMAGVIGKVNASDVQVLDYSSSAVQTLSKYYVKNGKLYHGIVTNLNDSGYASKITVGYKPSYLEEGKEYYSYDGHYFYLNSNNKESYKKMLTDYRNDTRANSVNANNPYYNYYQYISMRALSTFNSSQLNARISSVKGSSSVLYSKGDLFINAQNSYGVNTGLTFGLACNESEYGASTIAKTKNNIFGLNAVDSNPGGNASVFDSVDACIYNFAHGWITNRYLNGNNSVYRGPHLGDKNSGMNVKYASDPYWGEKAASQSYTLDSNKSDYGKYSIGIATSGKIYTYSQPSTSQKSIYSTADSSGKNIYDYPVTILDTVTGSDGNKWYKIQSDMPLNSTRTERNLNNDYSYSRDYVYVKASDVKVVFSSNNDGTTPTPTYTLGDVNMDGSINASDLLLMEKHVVGLNGYQLSGDVFKRADINSDGYINAQDMLKVEKYIVYGTPIN